MKHNQFLPIYLNGAFIAAKLIHHDNTRQIYLFNSKNLEFFIH